MCFEKCVTMIELFSIKKYSSTEKEPTHYLKYSSLFLTPPLAYPSVIPFYPTLDLGNTYPCYYLKPLLLSKVHQSESHLSRLLLSMTSLLVLSGSRMWRALYHGATRPYYYRTRQFQMLCTRDVPFAIRYPVMFTNPVYRRLIASVSIRSHTVYLSV